jgi:hypothetical protein
LIKSGIVYSYTQIKNGKHIIGFSMTTAWTRINEYNVRKIGNS